MARAAASALVIALLALAAAVPASAASPPRGHYMCYFYDVYGFPTLAAEIYILRDMRYAGPGKKNRGDYVLGRTTNKGQKVLFKGGAYGGWWGFYRRWDGTPTIALYNKQGSVGNGCPKS
jgi:hypothetical protein